MSQIGDQDYPWRNELSDYKISDKDDDGSPNFFGFVNSEGAWYIMEEVINPGGDTYKYFKGDSGYEDAWLQRASFQYDYFHNIF